MTATRWSNITIEVWFFFSSFTHVTSRIVSDWGSGRGILYSMQSFRDQADASTNAAYKVALGGVTLVS